MISLMRIILNCAFEYTEIHHGCQVPYSTIHQTFT